MMSSRTRIRICVALALLIVFSLARMMPKIADSTLDLRLPNPDDIRENFSWIYRNRVWGGDDHTETPFFSGPGSHDAEVVDPYVLATRSFISNTFKESPNIVDLGCGDFNVGQYIRNISNRYVACDVVPEVIEHNRDIYAGQDVKFEILDIVSEDLPAGDIVFVRQVFQHLRNGQISQVLPKLSRYRWAIITEHIPVKDPFTPNMDTSMTGPTRLPYSGIDLLQPPFNFQHYGATELCELFAEDGRIRTVAYQLQE